MPSHLETSDALRFYLILLINYVIHPVGAKPLLRAIHNRESEGESSAKFIGMRVYAMSCSAGFH